MKKLILLISILSFMGCDKEELNPFIGTWYTPQTVGVTYIFTQDSLEIISDDQPNSHYMMGYNYNGSTLNLIDDDGEIIPHQYVITSTTLDITEPPYPFTYNFVKQ